MAGDLKELSLFAGAGGGLLASHLLGWSTIGYVEIDDYCQRIIAQRIRDGYLPAAPIFGDIRAFLSEGYAASYTGLVDVVSGGFPCQPFSLAGKRANADDERNMWPATVGVIRMVRPRFCLLENVPGLLTSGYFGRILGDLAESGYDCRWRILSAAELGAPHKRDRLWIVAHAKSQQAGLARQTREHGSLAALADADSYHSNGRSGIVQSRGQRRQGATQEVCDAGRIKWPAQSEPVRVAYGVPYRVDRLRATGNGQVPAVAATAWRILMTEDLL